MKKTKKTYVIWTILAFIIFGAVYGQIKTYPENEIAKETLVGNEVSFNSNRINLKGNLLMPKNNKTKYPAVVFSIGSGADSYKLDFKPNDKLKFWKNISDIFLNMGYAVLFIEKRGINGSEGNWQKNSIDGRATDVLAGVDFLKKRKDIDPSKIGLLGHSQGGWVVQAASTKNKEDVSFIINISGSVSTPIEQEIANLSGEWRCSGMEESKILKKSNSLRFKLKIFKAFSWLIKTNHFSRIIKHNSPRVFNNIECPVLAIYGENDVLVPMEKNIKLMELGIKNDSLLTVVKINGVTHGMHKGELCSRYGSQKIVDYSISSKLKNSIENWKFIKHPNMDIKQ